MASAPADGARWRPSAGGSACRPRQAGRQDHGGERRKAADDDAHGRGSPGAAAGRARTPAARAAPPRFARNASRAARKHARRGGDARAARTAGARPRTSAGGSATGRPLSFEPLGLVLAPLPLGSRGRACRRVDGHPSRGIGRHEAPPPRAHAEVFPRVVSRPSVFNLHLARSRAVPRRSCAGSPDRAAFGPHGGRPSPFVVLAHVLGPRSWMRSAPFSRG